MHRGTLPRVARLPVACGAHSGRRRPRRSIDELGSCLKGLVSLARLFQRWLVRPDYAGRFPVWAAEPIPLTAEGLVQAATRFMARFEQFYFPTQFADFLGDDDDLLSYGLTYLWPDVRGLDIYALELDDFPEPTRCLLALWGLHWEAGWDTAAELWATGRYAGLAPPGVRPDQLSAALPAILDQLLTQPLTGPLAALPTLLQLIFKETGNLFLDFGPDELAESGLTFSWREETVLALQAVWREAAPRLAALEALAHWVATDESALQSILDLLLAAWAAAQSPDAAPRQLPLLPV